MFRRPWFACVWIAGLLTALVSAQQSTAQQSTTPQSTTPQSTEQQPTEQERPQAPVFRTGTNLVRVDVSVLDRDGKPVRSLTADDFEVRENGEVQAITSFKLVDANGEPTSDMSLPIRSREHAAAEAARDDVRVFLIFWDEYHIEQFGSAVRAREQLTRFVLESFGPTDLVGLMDQLTPVDAIRFTRDRRALADQVHLLKGRRGIYVPARSAIEEGHLRNAQDVERIRSQVTTSALKSAVMHLGSIRQGRKAVVLVTETFGRLGQDAVRVLSDLIRTANDNNTAVYTVDPRGLQAGPGGFGAGMTGLLASLADATGAESIVSNDMGSALRKVVAHSSAFYLLGYSPKDAQLDGKFREIKVRVRQSGVQVRARNGYWAPRGSEIERARAIAAAAALPSTVSLALKELTPDNSRRAAALWVGVVPGADGPELRVAWSPRSGIEGRLAAASVSLIVTSGGQRIFEGPLDESGTTFRSPPGSVELDFTIKDRTGESIDREQRTFTVPDTQKATLALTTPVLSRARNTSEFRAMSASPMVHAGREFSREDRLLIRVSPYGTASADAEVTAQLLGPRGNTLLELPIHATADGKVYEVDLPLRTLASGEFLIALGARTATDRVETLVPLRIGR
jgi:VWFA-related protein